MVGLLNLFKREKKSLKSYCQKSYRDWQRKKDEKDEADWNRILDEEEWIRHHKHDPEFLRSIGNTSYKPQKVNTGLFLSDIMTNKKRRI